MIVINLFGGPGAGKSTTAAGLFFKMKTDKHVKSVELVTEFAKDMVYAQRMKELSENQLYITSKQHHKMERVRNQVDYLITDSPVLQGLVYTPINYLAFFEPLVKEVYYSFNNFNILLRRVKDFKEYGRTQKEEKAKELDRNIRALLAENNIKYWEVDGDENAPETIKSLLLI
jgi:hypothetical protein